MINSDAVYTALLNYGLAGVVVYIFYRLLSSEISELRSEIARLREAIEALARVCRCA